MKDLVLAYRSIAVLVRRDGRWLIHPFLGSEPVEMPDRARVRGSR